MIEFYPQVKLLHLACVIASGSLFLFRGLLVQVGRQAMAMAALPRYLSYGIDTVLLTSALMLVTMLPGAMFANGWLTVKLLLVATYVVLGSLALKRGRSASTRRNCYIAAVLVFVFAAGVARLHHPLGVFVLLR